MKRILIALALVFSASAQAALVKSPRIIAGTSTNACWAESSSFAIVTKACNQDDNVQQFEVTAGTAAGYYKIRSRTGRCVGVRSATVTTPAEVLVTRACSSNIGDEWKFRRLSGAPNFKIQSRLGSLIAGTQSSPVEATTAVDMYTDESSDTQDWALVEHVNKARPSDTAVRTLTGKGFASKLSGATVLPSTEVDLTDCDGLVCKVVGSNPARYAPAKAFVPGMTGADLVNSIAIEETSPPVTVTVATAASISGSAVENQALTGVPATFTNYSGAVVNEWLRGGSVVSSGTTYTLGAADIGQSITFRSSAGSVTSSASSATVVAAGGSSNWAGGTVTAPFSGLTNSGPITATSNQVIQGRNISNPNGTCITIPAGVTNVTIRGNNIGPCGRISTDNGSGAGFGVHVQGGTGHTIQANWISNVAGAVLAQGPGLLKIDRNGFHNVRGGVGPSGGRYIAGLQFNAHTGASGRSSVTCNLMDASTWTTTPTTQQPGIEDGFSTNNSSNVTYAYNWIRGGVSAGYSSATGSCMSIGDDSGNNNQARFNRCVRTPNNGIFTAGGSDHVVENNYVFNIGTAGSNTQLSYGASFFQGATGSDQIFRNNVGYASNWKSGTGSIDAWASFFSPVPGRDGVSFYVPGLVLYGNNFRDTTLTESSVWGTGPSGVCAGTGNVNDGTITYPLVAQTIPLQSTITARTVPYPRFTPANWQGYVGYELFNNNWTANQSGGNNGLNNSPGWSQSVGIESVQPNISINARIKWSYPQRYFNPSNGEALEVLNYPGIAYGRGATTSASFPQNGAKLPKQISQITSLKTGYASLAGPMSGLGHVTYDLWASDTPNSTFPEGTFGQPGYIQHRLAEIMLPRRVVGGYGIPNSPAGAAAGRNCSGVGTSATTCWGRNPNIYIERATIGGAQYDVYRAPPNSQYTGLGWNFIVFQPLTLPGTGPDTIEWKPFLDYINGKGWISNFNSQYLNAVEFGVEAINPNTYDLATGGSTGDIQVMGFWTEVNGARY